METKNNHAILLHKEGILVAIVRQEGIEDLYYTYELSISKIAELFGVERTLLYTLMVKRFGMEMRPAIRRGGLPLERIDALRALRGLGWSKERVSKGLAMASHTVDKFDVPNTPEPKE